MGAVPRDITTQPHLCLTWAIGECSMQGEGWAGWGTGQMAGGFLTQSESRAPRGRARYRPRGWGQRCWGLPVLAGAQRGSGDVLGTRGSMGRCRVAGMGPRETLLGCPLPIHGAQPRQGLAIRAAWAGWAPCCLQPGPAAPSSLSTPVPKRFPGRARGSHPGTAHKPCPCSLPPPAPPLLPAPGSRRLLPRSPSPVLPATQPCSAPFSPASSRPWLRQSPSSWLCWPSSTG